nr:hypothetical protein [Tanacetum cinerariifolium]
MPTKIRGFLRLAGYYRRFIKDFSKIVSPLTALTQKASKFIWGREEEQAFETLKQRLSSAPILALPDGIKDFVANAVADALSRKEGLEPIRFRAMRIDVKVDLIDQIRIAQNKALEEVNVTKERMLGKVKLLQQSKDGIQRLNGRIWIPKELQNVIMAEAHKSKYTMPSGSVTPAPNAIRLHSRN